MPSTGRVCFHLRTVVVASRMVVATLVAVDSFNGFASRCSRLLALNRNQCVKIFEHINIFL